MRKENRLVSRKGWGLGWMIASILLGCCIGNAFAAPANSPVLLLGDSMMKLPSLAIERELAKTQPSVKAISFATIGTGLARLDAFDWLGKIDELCAQEHPKMAVVALGANDRQPMQLPSGGIVALGSPEWKTEYTHRIGEAMDRLIAGGCEQVVWLLLPPMRDTIVSEHAQQVNEILKEAAASRPGVRVYDFSSLVADRRTGGYTEHLMDPKTAAAIRVRDPDGIHLTPDGARRLATALIKEFWATP